MLKQIWRDRGRWRGRPSNRGYSYKDGRILEYLARIAVKHEVDSDELFNCIVEAWDNNEAECQKLAISCRKKAKDSAIFLFTKGQKVVGQFSIPTTILQGNNRIESYVRTMQLKRASSVKSVEGENVQIKDLKAGMRKVSLRAEVVEKPEPKMVYTRYGTTPSVSNVLIKDETGSIRMSLWNQQINMISKGDLVHIENGKVANFRGELQLRIARNGSVNVICARGVNVNDDQSRRSV